VYTPLQGQFFFRSPQSALQPDERYFERKKNLSANTKSYRCKVWNNRYIKIYI